MTLEKDDLGALMESVELDPTQQFVVDVEARSVTSRAGTAKGAIPDGARQQLLEGSWDGTAILLDAGEAIEQRAGTLPYVQEFRG